MLRVMYEAADDLAPGVISDWDQRRGFLRIRVHKHATPQQFTQALNDITEEVLANWFQLWRGEIVSVASPGTPLRVLYRVSDFSPAPLVEIRESKGAVILNIAPSATVEEFTQALNASLDELLAGGQWFQQWEGEIVTMDSPEVVLA
ncbi:hypothetical protein OG784_13090 [Streptomyces sp. NBC_01617]|uniref:hypothetical protein n=1 Tax=Streptomyces sp. NBC_01617 TaxID=2975899 RepID=UPI00387014AB|nr:hypothetical protein OG784_13090 [Streptomyces sp. NBC_01617]